EPAGTVLGRGPVVSATGHHANAQGTAGRRGDGGSRGDDRRTGDSGPQQRIGEHRGGGLASSAGEDRALASTALPGQQAGPRPGFPRSTRRRGGAAGG